MNAVVERSENSQVILKVEVEPERLAKATDRAYQRLVQRVNIPGFRRGKAPRKILERAVGTDALYREALDFVMPSAYDEAVKETGIEPYSRPEFEVVELEPEKPLVFKATVPVQPTVKLGDWKSIDIAPDDFSVTQEELDKALENVRTANGQWIPIEDRAVRTGDQVTLDVLTTLDGRQLSDTPREVLAELDQESPVPSWANQLAGLELGGQKVIDEDISPEYRDQNLAGKTASYSVTVKAIKQRELPEVDDELARTVGDYDDLDALKADLRKRLEQQKKAQAKDKFETELVDKLVEISTIDYPAVMIEQELDQMMREMDTSFRRQGFSLDMFLRSSQQGPDELRREWQPRAVRRVQQALALRQVIDDDKLQVDPAKLQTELDRMIDDTPADRREEVRQLMAGDRARQSVSQELLLRQALDVLDRAAGGDQFVELEGDR